MKTAMRSNKKNETLTLAFDVGHSSIGWAVLDANHFELRGCGSVIFPADDCLASQRRSFRRQRRHIRATRQRIERMKSLLESADILGRGELDKPGCAWPWFLAARVLRNGALLTWAELWDVLRWYAHNRGYNGNRDWSAVETEADLEDTEKVNNARALYEKHGTHSMAETFCSVCGIDPLGDKKSCHLPGDKRPTGLNAAFPREDVEREVLTVLEKHLEKLTGLTRQLIDAFMRDGRSLPFSALKLPLRYSGGLLFGQLLPRFDNRIIAQCPIMFEREFQQALQSGSDTECAKEVATKAAKVPNKECREFYEFRWAMLLANIQIADEKGSLQPLIKKAEWRKAVDAAIREEGYLTATELKKFIRALTNHAQDNLEQLFLHPDSEKALILDPARRLVANKGALKSLWNELPETIRLHTLNNWRRGRKIALADILDKLPTGRTRLVALLDQHVAVANTKKRKTLCNSADLLAEKHEIIPLKGRAPYHREIMRAAVADVLEKGRHPAEEGGTLYRSEAIRTAQLRRTLDEQTNNHLVRHRLLILERLHRDILKEYSGSDAACISKVTIEVNRDLRELSGKTAKEVAADLGNRLANFKDVTKRLEKAFEGKNIAVTPGLIRKARIAEDLGWKCPYTGKGYDEFDLLYRKVDKDHIIPRSLRPSDSLDSLVITFSEINKWKGQRTALRFIEEEQGKQVEGLPNLTIKTLNIFQADVKVLETYKGHDDDKRRKKNRQRLLQLRDYVDKEFTPRDLTVTSQLVRLGAQVLQKAYQQNHKLPVFTSIPGGVTGAVRKSWDLLGCLSAANTNVLDEKGEVKTKTEIRDITHLHHALDACVLAYATEFLPRDGGVWELLIKRRLSDAEQRLLRKHLGNMVSIAADGQFRLADLPEGFKAQIRARLAERRVIQHLPAEMTGLRVEQNAWRVVKVENGFVHLRQRIRQPDGTRPLKEAKEKIGKVLGLQPGGLHDRKAALVIPANYGLALDPEPTIIPFHNVWPRIIELREKNGGKAPRILRNGMLIRIPSGNYAGLWRILSTKQTEAYGLALDLAFPDTDKLAYGNARVPGLCANGLTIVEHSFCGVDGEKEFYAEQKKRLRRTKKTESKP